MVFQDNIPIYVQIANDIKGQISAGTLREEDKLPSIREYSVKYSVTALTMQRAMALLESENVVHTKKGVGSFVRAGVREVLRGNILTEHVKGFLDRLMHMGLSGDEITALVKEGLKDE